MMPDNTYVSRVAKLTDDEVKDALRNHDKYVDGMLLALLDECDKRNIQLQGIGHPIEAGKNSWCVQYNLGTSCRLAVAYLHIPRA